MNTEKDKYISPQEFEILQDIYKCKVEYDNGNIIQCTLKDEYYSINTYHSGDIYISSGFLELKIDLKDIF